MKTVYGKQKVKDFSKTQELTTLVISLLADYRNNYENKFEKDYEVVIWKAGKLKIKKEIQERKDSLKSKIKGLDCIGSIYLYFDELLALLVVSREGLK